MENVIYRPFARIGARRFLQNLLIEIGSIDPVHCKLISENISKSRRLNKQLFDELLNIIFRYYKSLKMSPEMAARDYMHMVDDIRMETRYFIKTGEYSCKTQQEAYERVYSQRNVMTYYMNGLLMSQLFWAHHFEMLLHFTEQMQSLRRSHRLPTGFKSLEIGAGHGLYSWLIKSKSNYRCSIDIYDISDVALDITRKMLGDGVNYTTTLPDKKYDLIILGEVLEHLDDPRKMLEQVKDLLSEYGVLWITVPINAPSIDHVYLFTSKDSLVQLINIADLQIISRVITVADYMTQVVGILCKKWNTKT